MALLPVFFAVAAQAAPVTFSRYSLDLPEGWSYEEDYKTGMVRLFANDRSALTFVVMAFHKDKTLMELAKELSTQLGGGEPKQVKDLEVSFAVQQPNIAETACRLWKWQDHHEFLFSCDTGKSPHFATIRDSFDMNMSESYSIFEEPVAFDLPEGWNYNHNKDATIVSIYPGEDLEKADAAVTATYGKLRKDMADALDYFATVYKAKEAPKKVKEGVYTFQGTVENRPVPCTMFDYTPHFLLTCTLGTTPEIQKLATSVRYVTE